MNKQITLAHRALGMPTEDTWKLEEHPIPEISKNQMLLKIHYISLDPAMRVWINDVRSYLPPVQIGDVMRAGTIGEVIASNVDTFAVGSFVLGTGGVQQYVVTDGRGWVSIDPTIAPLPKYLSVLGMTGFTAYFGLLDIGQPKAGETILISGAAGAVGSIVGQIGKIKKCRVVGIAGGKEKCQYLTEELNFDAAIDYKSDDVRNKLREYCPQGIDVYFDNVGGEILDLALGRINRRGRVVLCGGISQYNSETGARGPSNYLALLTQRARMEGFIVLDYVKSFPQAAAKMGQWMLEGKLHSKEHIEYGIEQFYPAFVKLFSGEKKGKMVLKVLE